MYFGGVARGLRRIRRSVGGSGPDGRGVQQAEGVASALLQRAQRSRHTGLGVLRIILGQAPREGSIFDIMDDKHNGWGHLRAGLVPGPW